MHHSSFDTLKIISSDGLPSQRVSYVEESTTHLAAWTERRDRQRWEHDCLRALRTGDVDGIIWKQLLPPDTLNNDNLWRGPDQHHIRELLSLPCPPGLQCVADRNAVQMSSLGCQGSDVAARDPR
ncbi:unnamed protein product [Boreogadus saida]